MDKANRYPATVTFRAISDPNDPDGPQLYRGCCGVLIASNLVLTAAHCVCAPSHGEAIRFDGSQCAAKAEIKAHAIMSWRDGIPGWGEYPRTGNILVHPRFEIALDTQGAVITSHADLAIIRLDEALPLPEFPPVHLATEEAKAGEVLSVVGFGYYEDWGWMDEWRRSSQEEVQAPAGDDRLRFGPMKLAGYKGDTGGPCLRETKQGLELVGISQRGLGRAPAFTRITPYREWLEEQIRLAKEKH